MMSNNILDLFEARSFSISSNTLNKDDIRFNADYFLSSDNINYKSGIVFTTLSHYANVVFPGIFKRRLVDDPANGVPFISTSGMMEFNPEPEKYLSKELTPSIGLYKVEEDWILVSRSGTIGNTVYTSSNLTRFAITEDALRVIPKDKHFCGYLYFYLTSEYGKDNIVGKKGGAVIDHIYEDDLLNLVVPQISDALLTSLQDIYMKIKGCRENANKLLSECDELFHDVNRLSHLEPRMTNSIQFISSKSIGDEYRLDAHFYNPVVKILLEEISQKAFSYASLEEVTERVFYLNRFSRTFVNKDYGVPYLAGKDIIRIRPSTQEYLSRQETIGLNSYFLHKGWSLLTCSGTIGRTCFVWGNYENHVATHDLIRIVPNEKIDAGYLATFLQSEYGYQQIIRYKHGAVIDHITPEQVENIIVPLPESEQQKEIGDKTRLAYELRSEANKLEDEAQQILKQALTE